MENDNVIKILHLEDNPTDAQLVQSILRKAAINFDYIFIDNEADYLSNLENQKIDIILSDYHLPDYSGPEALLVAKNNYPLIPFVFISGTMGEDAAIESLLNGATDYVLKNKMERLVPAVQRAIKEAQQQRARQKAEDELRENEQNYRTLADSGRALVWLASVDKLCYYFNRVWLEFTGRTLEQELGNGWVEGVHPDDLQYCLDIYLGAFDRRENFSMEYRLRRNDGEYRWIIDDGCPRYNSKGEFIGYIGHCLDITQSKLAELLLLEKTKEIEAQNAELILAKNKAEESDRLKTAFLHNISHEIRTPMNAIVGFSGLLNEPDIEPQKRKGFTDLIIQSSFQLLSIITDIISIATIEAGQEKIHENEIALDITLKLIQEQFLLKAKKENVCIGLNFPYSVTKENILTDETKLVEILTNLIGNAFKFTSKGIINFGYEIVKETEHSPALLKFFVEDTGIGIPPEMQEEIFKRFRQVDTNAVRESGGSGLGLSISKAYVELLGGKIWVESEVGKGSTFYFTIPLKKARKDIKPEIPGNNDFTTESNLPKTILIAEDEDSNFWLLEEILLGLNMKIIRAKNGLEAVDICKSDSTIDLVLMDIKMPVMDGYEATKQIRAFLPNLPIITQTAFSTDFDRNKAMACGSNDFVSKPFTRDVIVSKISELFCKV